MYQFLVYNLKKKKKLKSNTCLFPFGGFRILIFIYTEQICLTTQKIRGEKVLSDNYNSYILNSKFYSPCSPNTEISKLSVKGQRLSILELCKPYGLLSHYSALQLKYESSHRLNVWLCSDKTITKSNDGPDWAHWPLFIDLCHKRTHSFCFHPNYGFHLLSLIFPFCLGF